MYIVHIKRIPKYKWQYVLIFFRAFNRLTAMFLHNAVIKCVSLDWSSGLYYK